MTTLRYLAAGLCLFVCTGLLLALAESKIQRRQAESKQSQARARAEETEGLLSKAQADLSACQDEQKKAQSSDMQRTVCRDGKIICRTLGAIRVSPAGKR